MENTQWSSRRAIAVAGLNYAAIGLLLGRAAAAGSLGFSSQRWNLAAFVLCAVVALAHAALERLAWGRSALKSAWHVGLGGALGGLGLALAANVHELTAAQSFRPSIAIALIAWPALTGSAAFLGGYVAAIVFPRLAGSKART